MAFPTGWGWSAPITIPALKISGTNSNFPVLLTEANFPTAMIDGGVSSALNGGGDVRFSEDSAGLTQLPCEIVSFVTGITPSAEVWVKLPTLNSGADKIIYVWYSNPGQVQPLVTNLYGRNAVWATDGIALHFNAASGSLIDSSGNGNNGSLANGTSTYNVAGPFGRALSITSTDNVIVADSASYSLAAGGTISALVKAPTGLIGWWNLWSKFSGTSGIFLQNYAGAGKLFYDTPAGWNYVLGLDTAVASGAWVWIEQTFDGANSNIYINGSLFNSQPASSPADITTQSLKIGDNGFVAEYAEFGIRSSVASAGEALTRYNNQSSPSTFAMAGTPVASGGGGSTLSPDNAASGHTAGNVTLSQAQALFVSKATHGLSSDQVMLSQGQVMTVAGATHALSSDSPALFQSQTLSVQDSTDALSSDNVTFAQIQALVIQNATHGIASSNGTFNPTPIVPDPSRTIIASARGRTALPPATDRILHPTHSRTLRI